jgi:hypothetical protein
MRSVRTASLAVIICLAAVPIFVSNADAFAGVSTYEIGATKYYEADLTEIRYLPDLPPALKVTLDLLSRCRAGAEAFVGSPITSGRWGIVLYSPTSISACFASAARSAALGERLRSTMPSAIGTPSSFSPCKRYFRASWGNGVQNGPFAFVAATDLQTCEQLTVEVPGGLTVSVGPGYEAVKAQAYDAHGHLLDYVTPIVPPPATLNPRWILDNGTWGRQPSVPFF